MSNPYAPPQAAVHDVSVAEAGIVPADRGARLGASILDSFIFMLMVYLPFMIGVLISRGQRRSRRPDGDSSVAA